MACIVNKVICAPAALESHVLLSSTIFLHRPIFSISKHTLTTHKRQRMVACTSPRGAERCLALRCVAAPDPV